MEIKITKTKQPKVKPDKSNLGFGRFFTDHMFIMDYSPDKGWFNPRIEPYQPFQMDPATIVLHYGQAVFEGLKAFKTSDSKIQLFRPFENFKRMNNSSARLCIPQFDEKLVMEGLKKLIEIDEQWIPEDDGTALYIRPTVIGTDPFLGVRASDTYRFYIILSPVGAYYSAGFNPIKIAVEAEYVRAVKGGVGDAKTIGNYAASLLAGSNAAKDGYNQVLWLDGIEKKYIEEVGAMNIFFKIKNEIVTPELSGSILPGVTRNSVIYLLKQWGLDISERKISIDEIKAAYQAGELEEVFGTGTAAVISPVGVIKYENQDMIINNEKVGPLTDKLYQAIMDIQYGRTQAPSQWIEPVG